MVKRSCLESQRDRHSWNIHIDTGLESVTQHHDCFSWSLGTRVTEGSSKVLVVFL